MQSTQPARTRRRFYGQKPPDLPFYRFCLWKMSNLFLLTTFLRNLTKVTSIPQNFIRIQIWNPVNAIYPWLRSKALLKSELLQDLKQFVSPAKVSQLLGQEWLLLWHQIWHQHRDKKDRDDGKRPPELWFHSLYYQTHKLKFTGTLPAPEIIIPNYFVVLNQILGSKHRTASVLLAFLVWVEFYLSNIWYRKPS